MPASLTLSRVALRDPEGALLFSDLSLALTTARIGLVGRNGSGKSSLLQLLACGGTPAEGTITLHGTTGILAQEWPGHWTLGRALGVEQSLALLRRVVAGEGSAADLDHADWTLESVIKGALASADLPSDLRLDRRISTLSGGERTRVGIARLLIERPDFLLLDEPTNNLDTSGRAAISRLVEDWRGGVITSSHDRGLLEMMDRIVELTPVGIRIVGGGWSAFADQREAEREQASHALERAQSAVDEARRAAQQERESKARRDKAGRAFASKRSEPKILLGRQAERAQNSGARGQKLADRMIGQSEIAASAARERIEVIAPLTIDLPQARLAPDADLLVLDDVVLERAGREFGPWSLQVRGPERIAIEGPNGAGKSTLLRLAAGQIEPDGGSVRRRGRHVLLDQHLAMLDGEATVLDNVMRTAPDLDRRQAQATCAHFAFRNRDAARLVSSLSGGERMRAALACALGGSEPGCLLMLDEPTNHLDIETVEVLENALSTWNGALLVVSHDQSLLGALGIERRFRIEPAEVSP